MRRSSFRVVGRLVVCGIFLGLSLAAEHASAQGSWTPAKSARAAQVVVNTIPPGSRFASMSLTVAVNGSIVYVANFGTDVSGSPITPNSHFEIGSVSKQLTAAGIWALQED